MMLEYDPPCPFSFPAQTKQGTETDKEDEAGMQNDQ